jgi:hypothetical protein
MPELLTSRTLWVAVPANNMSGPKLKKIAAWLFPLLTDSAGALLAGPLSDTETTDVDGAELPEIEADVPVNDPVANELLVSLPLMVWSTLKVLLWSV